MVWHDPLDSLCCWPRHPISPGRIPSCTVLALDEAYAQAYAANRNNYRGAFDFNGDIIFVQFVRIVRIYVNRKISNTWNNWLNIFNTLII